MYHFGVNSEIKKASDRRDVSKLICRALHAIILYLPSLLFFFSSPVSVT